MQSNQFRYTMLLILSGAGLIFDLLPLLTPLPFALCAIVTALCFLVGAALVLFVIPKSIRLEGDREKLPLSVRTIFLAFWATAILALFILPYAGLVQKPMLFAVVLVAVSCVAAWITLLVLVWQEKQKKP